MPPANWYTDPENPTMQRWWDGVQWGPQRRAAAVQPYSMEGPYQQTMPDASTLATSVQLRKANGVGFAGAVLSLASLLLNPYALVGILGIVLCGIGLARDIRMRAAGNIATGRGWVIAGLVIGVVSTILYLYLQLVRLGQSSY